MKAIINGTLILENETLENSYIRFDDCVRAYGPMKEYSAEEGDEILDANGSYVSPGFVDIHIHGFAGADSMDGDVEALKIISNAVRKNGVTSYLATTMTMSNESIIKALETIKAYENEEGAKIVGVHLEGPFIHPDKKGAQNEQFIQNPNFELIKDHLDIIRLITIAPDTEGAFEFIEKLKAYPHIKLSIGHTNSDFETAERAKACGVNHITHCFNAMPPLHHRKPGVLGSMLAGGYTAELIADNIHVHKGLYKGLHRVLGDENLILVTDSMRAGGLEDGIYDLGGQAVKVAEGSARLVVDDSLAGSVLKMNDAIKNVLSATDLTINQVINLATLNPAKVIGLDQEIGSIAIGKKADLVILSDRFEIEKTFVNGK